MSYIAGFVAPVPADKKQAYIEQAARSAPLFKEFGVTRMVENWGDQVPQGKRTDFLRAVKAEPEEVVVFSWQEFPSKEKATTAFDTMMNDPRMREIGESMPFDGKRMIFGGFEVVLDQGAGEGMRYVDGSLIAVPLANREAYTAAMKTMADLFAEHGALRSVEAWGDYVPDGQTTDFKRAVEAKSDETVVFTWIEWPSRQARDKAWGALFADPRMNSEQSLFDEGRRIFGGFVPIFDA